MTKKLIFCITVLLPFTALASIWHKIANKPCGYSLAYPGLARPLHYSAWKKTYLNPLALLSAKQINKRCSLQIALPITESYTNLTAKTLYVLALNKMPILKKSSYSDAGMCHQVLADCYFMKRHNKNYALVFALNSECVGVKKGLDKAFNQQKETRFFRDILLSFK